MKQHNVGQEDFVLAWQQSDSVAEAAAKLSMSSNSVRARASRYRGKGVNLKTMGPGRKLSVEALSKLSGTGLNTTSRGG